MSTLVTMTLDELREQPLTENEIRIIRAAAAKARTADTDYDPDCPRSTKKELAAFRPLRNVKPELFAQLHPDAIGKKNDIHIKIDTGILENVIL